MNRRGRIHPDHIHICKLSKWQEIVSKLLAEPDLWNLPDKNIAGMDVKTEIRARHTVNNRCAKSAHEIAVCRAGKNSVHITVKKRICLARHIDPERIESRIDIHYSHEIFRVLIYAP